MHDNFAYIYDEFTKNLDYKAWYKFLRKYIKKKDKLLDIGCGTATISSFFEKDGFDVVGLDISASMLELANKKNSNIRYIKHDIQKGPIDEHFKYIISNFDTVNYLDSIDKFIENCSNMQKENSILIFDVVLEQIFDEIFENDLFIDEEDNYTAIWYHEKLDDNKHMVDINMFLKQENDLYKKYVENHIKYIYDIEYIIETLNKYGYYLYDMAKNPEYSENRIFIIAKK